MEIVSSAPWRVYYLELHFTCSFAQFGHSSAVMVREASFKGAYERPIQPSSHKRKAFAAKIFKFETGNSEFV